jgi:signal transduction histidine kinase/CheY-like chemotaxis protein
MVNMLRSRLLHAALVPVVVVVVSLVTLFMNVRLGELKEAHQQRGTLLLRQLALGSEYGVFSGNQASLQAVALEIRKHPDVRGVAVFDASGALLVTAGAWAATSYSDVATAAAASAVHERGVKTLTAAIAAHKVSLEDVFYGGLTGMPGQAAAQGYVALEFSDDSRQALAHQLLFWSVASGLLGIALAWLIADRLSRRVMRPVFRVSQRIAQIGAGDFTVQPPSTAPDPLAALQLGLNAMAQQLRMGRDALEQRVAQVTQELRLKKEEAELATAAKSRFLAAASHDLRQPTHALGMLIARLGQLPMNDSMRDVVRNVALAVKATQDLLDALLDVSRFDAGAVEVNVQPVNLALLLEQVEFNLAVSAQAKGLRLHLRAGPQWVLSDAVLLQRMVMNLAHNAVRYTERGTVLLACRPVGGGQRVRIDVLDSGIGISAAHQTRIFQEFYQVANAQRDRSYGLGLGLSIVDRGARLLGHAVELRSAPGCGTRFSITVPIAAPPVLGADRTQERWCEDDYFHDHHQHGHDHAPLCARVLVIEDDALSLNALATLLGSWGYQVRAVPDLPQALQALHGGFAPELLVSDYRIGEGVNGLDAIASLRALAGFAVPACLISGDAHAELIAAASALGLKLLHKPVRPEQLRLVLRELVGEVVGELVGENAP